SLQRGLDRYVHVTMVQMASAVACQRFHLIGPRLARWLLMTQDRASADSFRVTHERLAGVLGVRRVGITTAAVALQRQGLIEYHRGALTVIDRLGLEAVACSCYQVDLHVHAEWLPMP
ncbi:MAG TPA: helix-turn-helix domain-containing protein, partial [Aquabacterium sp.]|uniref:Crp/Fnr family transcriptional regulator n=1 Tax=Aquabacterium sp. TaxID=1872578 RepID=UPI002E2FD16D